VARSIIVGDVHGCSAELAALLDRVGLGQDDQVVFVGDVVARGPDSPGVLALLREVSGRSVVGNHEAKLLRARAAVRSGTPPPHLGRSHRQVMAQLQPRDWALLESFPYTLELGEHDVCVVHAGVVPGVALAEQDPRLLVTMRSIDASGAPSDRLDGTPWGALYRGPPHIVFGHNAVASLQFFPDATGLDSGCVYGGRLTALVLPHGARTPPVESRGDVLVSVRAAQRYYSFSTKVGRS